MKVTRASRPCEQRQHGRDARVTNMASGTYILCPGQGAQVVGMGKDLATKSAAARQAFEAAGRGVGFDPASICFNGPEERLNQTDVSQPALYVAGVASFLAAKEQGKLDPKD